MQRTKIEWADYTLNPIKGYCPNNCPYCYAHRMYNRFGWDKTLRFDESVLTPIDTLKEPSRVFIGSMIDMYHPEIPTIYVEWIIHLTLRFPQHTFITLTKYPENLYKFDFPENWWIGTTMENQKHNQRYYDLIRNNNLHNNLFISFEPLLTSMETVAIAAVDWIIIGGLTPKPVHKNEWIDDIVRRADDLHISVFIKPNAHYSIKREEFPE